MKIVTQVKLMPDAVQASVLERPLRTVNDAANWVSQVAFKHGVPREYELRKHTYAELKARGLGAQAAQHVIKKVSDSYTTLRANIRAGNLGKGGSGRRRKAESKPVMFRPQAAQPYDAACPSKSSRASATGYGSASPNGSHSTPGPSPSSQTSSSTRPSAGRESRVPATP
nr:hypothetical protein [Streptomyces canus]